MKVESLDLANDIIETLYEDGFTYNHGNITKDCLTKFVKVAYIMINDGHFNYVDFKQDRENKNFIINLE